MSDLIDDADGACSLYLKLLFDGDALSVWCVGMLHPITIFQVHDRSWRNVLLQTKTYLYTYTLTDEVIISLKYSLFSSNITDCGPDRDGSGDNDATDNSTILRHANERHA